MFELSVITFHVLQNPSVGLKQFDNFSNFVSSHYVAVVIV